MSGDVTATMSLIMGENRGRPFDMDVDYAIGSSARSLLADKGFEGLTVSEIVEAAGTTRSAFYRRYKDFLELTLDILVHDFPMPGDGRFDTGSLEGDLRSIQFYQLDFFAAPVVNRSLGGFLGQLRSNDLVRESFLASVLGPQREAAKRVIERAADRHEISSPYDIDVVCDLLMGPFIIRVMLPEIGPLDAHLAEETVEAALAALHYSR